jgi:hypothetical protein
LTEKRSSIRQRIAEQAEEMGPELRAFFAEALVAQREMHVGCPSCNKRFPVTVPDWNARTKVVETMLNQGYGRPGSDDNADGAGGFILKRVIVHPSGVEEVVSSDAA